MNITLGVIVRYICSDYILEQYCKHYSKYKEIKNIIVQIQIAKNTEIFKAVFIKYFGDRVIFEYFDGVYAISEEATFFTTLLNNVEINDWLLCTDMDEFICLENIDSDYFLNYTFLHGTLIDRIKKEEHIFNATLNIFDNYSDNYFLYNVITTPFYNKIPLIKKIEIPTIVRCGHHLINRDEKNLIRNTLVKPIPVYHFKWRVDFLEFNKSCLENTDFRNCFIVKGEYESYSNNELYTVEFYEKIKLAKLSDEYLRDRYMC